MENGRELERIGAHSRAPQKDRLLRDIHHRVKNNLQVIASLISLQARPGIHPETQIILNQLQGRVRAIAALHETLYSSRDLGSILFGSYMQQLLRELLALHGVDRSRISLHVHAAEMVVSIEQALPLGLIFTELITNASKHGFKAQLRSLCNMCLPRGEEPQGELSVSR